jgi:hypothetical protein
VAISGSLAAQASFQQFCLVITSCVGYWFCYFVVFNSNHFIATSVQCYVYSTLHELYNHVRAYNDLRSNSSPL